MIVRITASHSRKVPDPHQQFATRSYAASIDAQAEVGEAEAAAVVARLHALWNELQRAVDERVAALCPDSRAEQRNGNGGQAPSTRGHQSNGHRSNGHQSNGHRTNGSNGTHERAAAHQSGNDNGTLSAKQKNFLLGLSSKRGWRIPRLNEELCQIFGRSDANLHGLSRREASLAIEAIRGEQQ